MLDFIVCALPVFGHYRLCFARVWTLSSGFQFFVLWNPVICVTPATASILGLFLECVGVIRSRCNRFLLVHPGPSNCFYLYPIFARRLTGLALDG